MIRLYTKDIDSIDTNQERYSPSMYIGLSKISGLGLFAHESIEKNTHCGWYYGKIYIEHPENDSQYILQVERKPCWVSEKCWNNRIKGLFIDSKPGEIYSDPFHHTTKFSRLNHSDKPNVKFLQNGRIVAIKNIKKNEELLVNYGNEFFNS